MKNQLKPKKLINSAILAAVVSLAFFMVFGAVLAQTVPWSGPTAQPPGDNVNGLIFNRDLNLPIQDAAINISRAVYADAFCLRLADPETGASPYCISNWGNIIGRESGDYWTLDGSNLYAADPGWYLGLGTDVPAVKLEINDESDNPTQARVTDIVQNPEWQLQYGEQPDDHWGIYNEQTNGSLNIWGGGDNRLTILPDGKVGIGTNGPNQQLEIAGNFRLPPTTASAGVIYSGGNTLLHTFGRQNIFLGIDAGNLTMTGIKNTGIGYRTLPANTSGSANTAIGEGTLSLNATGHSNTSSGADSLASNTTGYANTADGYSALYSNRAGNLNTAVGYLAGVFNISGSFNTFIGGNADVFSDDFTVETAMSDLTNATAIGYNARVGASNAMVLGGLGEGAVKVGIGLISPNADLHVYRDFGDNAEIDIQSDSAAGSHWGIYQQRDDDAATTLHNEAGDLRFWQGGNRVAISNEGRVGIGATDPGQKLDIAGALRIRPSAVPAAANGVIYYDSTANKFRCYENGVWVDCVGGGGIGAGLPAGTLGQTLRHDGANWLATSNLYNNGVNVGIGAVPDPLDLLTKLNIAGQIKITGGSPGADKILTSDAAGLASWKNLGDISGGGQDDDWRGGGDTDPTLIGEIYHTGNVGIGLTDPNKNLHIKTAAGSNAEIDIQSGVNGWWGIYQEESSGDLRFWRGDNRMAITGAGNVGIGTILPDSAAKLEVAGQVKITGGIPGLDKVLASDAAGLASWKSLGDLGAGLGNITGAGTLNYVAKFTPDGAQIGNSQIFDNGASIGVGTITPQNKLDVEGGAVIGAAYSGTAAAPANGLLVEGNVGIGTTAPGAALQINPAATEEGLVIQLPATNPWAPINVRDGGGNTLLRVKENGQVSLGTYNADPNSAGTVLNVSALAKDGGISAGRTALEITGWMTDSAADNIQADIFFSAKGNTAAGNTRIGMIRGATQGTTANYRGGKLSFWTKKDGSANWNEALTIDNAGRVGIGTTAPNNLLQVAGLINFDDANFNTFLGKNSFNNSGGSQNTGVGWNAGLNNQTRPPTCGLSGTEPCNNGTQNTYIGNYAGLGEGNAGYSGWGNVALGASALKRITSGSRNVALGASALFSNTSGGNNIAVGSGEEGNVALGGAALYNNTAGGSNIAIGTAASYENTTGNSNTTIGLSTYRYNVSGGNNTVLGYQADGAGWYYSWNNQRVPPCFDTTCYQTPPLSTYSSRNRENNTIIGASAGYNNTEGESNVFLGNKAGYYQTTASNLLIIDNQSRGSLASPEEPAKSLIYGVFDLNPGNQSLTFNANVTINGTLNGHAADYAEWFEREETTKPGDLIGINLKTGKARKYRAGDKFIGIHSANPAYVGGQTKESKEEMAKTHVLTGLLGQLEFDQSQTIIKNRLVSTKDGQAVGVLLASGKVLLGR